MKLLLAIANLRKLQKFSTANDLHYTVVDLFEINTDYVHELDTV